MKKLKSLKIVKKTELNCTDTVYDLTVANSHHYIDENGMVHHNSGLYYSASVVSFLSKAKLKTGDEDEMDLGQSGIKVTFKTEKNRLAKPKKVKFDISFTKGCNPYVGLEAFCRPEFFEKIGIAKGKWESFKEPQEVIDENTGEITMVDGEFKPGGTRYYVRHLGKSVFEKQLYKPEVFTQEVLDAMNPYIQEYFGYKSLTEMEDIQEEYNKHDGSEDGLDADNVSSSDLFG